MTKKANSALQQCLPVLITSLVNKSGSIGLSLLPVLLVDFKYTTHQCSTVMIIVKGTTIAGTLLSGWLSDVFGLRPVLLFSFFLAALGMAFLPLKIGIIVLVIAGVIAQLGVTSINSLMRLLLVRTVERQNQKEALGWMRFVNNLGQIFSFGLATFAATIGAKVLIWFDALCSLGALVFGAKLLPRQNAVELAPKNNKNPKAKFIIKSQGLNSWWPFLGAMLIIAGWNFMYEFFMVGIAGRLKVLYPVEGIRIFSSLMVLNTILCAGLAVVASRVLSRVILSLFFGVVLTAFGLIMGMQSNGSIQIFFLSVFFITLGEIIYGALGQFLLIRSVPASQRENTIYSGALLLASVGRVIASGLAFPLVVYTHDFTRAIGAVIFVSLVSFFVLIIGKKQFAVLCSSAE